MNFELIDSHAHLHGPEFAADLAAVIARANAAGVSGIIAIPGEVQSSAATIAIARDYPGVWATVGIHPQQARPVTQADLDEIARLAQQPKVVAIGEIGLDFYHDYAPHPKQIQVLEAQLEIASTTGLPAVIHCRQAEAEMLPILQAWAPRAAKPGVIHCFNGMPEMARAYLDLGFYLSLGAYIGYSSSRALRELVKELPLDRLLLETDSPYLPPQDKRGQRNEPAYVTQTAATLASILNRPIEDIAVLTTANSRRLFGLIECKG